EPGPRAEIHPVRDEPRRAGAAGDVVMLLGHAGEQEGRAFRRGEEDAALRRAGRLPRPGAALSGAGRRPRQEDAGPLDGDAAGAVSLPMRLRPATAGRTPTPYPSPQGGGSRPRLAISETSCRVAPASR